MTRDEILSMPAGAEMDAEIELLLHPESASMPWAGHMPAVPPYSTSDAAALEVAKLLMGKNGGMFGQKELNPFRFFASFGPQPAETWYIEAPTLALAICRAALLAKGETK